MTDWADEKAREILGKYAGRSFRGVTADIAAALRSAVEEERRACEAIATKMIITGKSTYLPDFERGVNECASTIADAIEARAMPQTKGPSG